MAIIPQREATMKMKTIITVISALALLLSTSPTALAGEDSDATAMVVDAAVARPFTFALTVVGTALFVVSLPVAVPSGSVGKAAKTLVAAPAKDTFKRPLGDLKDFLEYD
jgi:hypothetical protein